MTGWYSTNQWELIWVFVRCSQGRQIGIRSQTADVAPDGSYSWSYETENGISAQESGYPKPGGPEGPIEVS